MGRQFINTTVLCLIFCIVIVLVIRMSELTNRLRDCDAFIQRSITKDDIGHIIDSVLVTNDSYTNHVTRPHCPVSNS